MEIRSFAIYVFMRIGVVAIEKGAFGSPSTTVANFTFYNCLQMIIEQEVTWKYMFTLKNHWLWHWIT